jgi:hypothetical protein
MRNCPLYGAGSVSSCRPRLADEPRRVTWHRKEALVVDADWLSRPRSSPILSSTLGKGRDRIG